MSAPTKSKQRETDARWDSTPPASAVLAELESIASQAEQADARCGLLFSRLRKAQGTPRLPALLAALEVHLRRGGPVGVRLLAAFLAVATDAERLLPRLRRFSSSRRYFLRLHADERGANCFARDWVKRLVAACGELPGAPGPKDGDRARPGDEYPWPQVRSWLTGCLPELATMPDGGDERSERLERWLRLELDALEERVGHLAGSVNPYRAATVQRLLPLLSDLDVVIRDARLWLGRLREGHLEEALRRPASLALEKIEPGEFRALMRAMGDAGAGRLLDLLRRRIEAARPDAELADDILRLQLLGQAMAAAGGPDPWPDPLTAAEAVVAAAGPAAVRCSLPPGARPTVAAVLQGECDLHPALQGVGLDDRTGEIVLPRRAEAETDRAWPHGLPVVRDGWIDDGDLAAGQPVRPAAGEPLEEQGASATRKLVMNSLQTMSVLLALLRNPKVTAIPGLVAEVATRTRNPQVIATIATDRALYTGFANRDVPLACLRNPSNVSVKVLRKFIHVKYVSKLDLVRLSQDRAGVRRELRHEIDRYLEALA